MSGQNFFLTTNHNFFFTKTLIMKMNVMISKLNFLILNKYWECYEITEYLKIDSWSKHVKQINEFLMAMRNMWWHFRFLAHLAFRPCELLSSLFVCRPSVNISHFNLLLRNHWANCNQSLVEWFLDGPLSKLCPVIPTSNQDGRQAQNRKKGGWNFNCPLLL
jgi:hypothetical protein